MRNTRKRCAVIIFIAIFAFSSCNEKQALIGNSGTTDDFAINNSSSTDKKQGAYIAPPFKDSAFNEASAEGENGVLVDCSSLSQGYVAVSAKNANRLKFRIIKDGFTYTQDLPSDGTHTMYPLAMGNGDYEFKVMQQTNAAESKYIPIYSTVQSVELENELDPFLRPNQYTNYNESSKCVEKAAQLAQNCDTDAEVAASIYAYIKDNISYDGDKAENVAKTYLPLPDETLQTGKGICFDYASLSAAMLRSQGIPTKIITGIVAPDNIDHAWNMVWLEKSGWIAVKIEVSAKKWERIDLTFAAGSAGAGFVGDGTNYTDEFVY